MPTMYVDESKRRGYILAATIVENHTAPSLRKALKREITSGRSIHFIDEKDSRRKQLLQAYIRLGFKVRIFSEDGKPDFDLRKVCLIRAFEFATQNGIEQVVIETDESILLLEKRFLNQLFKEREWSGIVGYDHKAKHEEPLIWVSDAVVWCVGRGGDWAKLAEPLILRNA
jgi:hypothetical protein